MYPYAYQEPQPFFGARFCGVLRLRLPVVLTPLGHHGDMSKRRGDSRYAQLLNVIRKHADSKWRDLDAKLYDGDGDLARVLEVRRARCRFRCRRRCCCCYPCCFLR